jgi:hypothetical protein
MKRAFPAAVAVVSGLMVSACMQTGTGSTGTGFEGAALAPPVPRDERSHGDLQRMTGINGDAVSAIAGDPSNALIYFDFFAANKEAVKAAPAKLCATYGKSLKSSYVTEPSNHEPGVKVLAVTCKG